MDIPFGNYQVSRFEEGWRVRRKYIPKTGKDVGKVTWNDPKYYGSLEVALRRTVDRMLREDDTEFVEDLLGVHEKILEVEEMILNFTDDLSKALRPS